MTKKSAFQKIKDAVASKPVPEQPAASLSTENGNHSELEVAPSVTPKQAELGLRPNAYTEALNKARKPLTKAVDNTERDNFAAQQIKNNGTAAE